LKTFVAKKKRKCITENARFQKLCLDAAVLELCIRNRADIRNDSEDNSTRTYRKTAYRQYILNKYDHLGKGETKVAPSCVVWCVRHHYPASTGLYMGFSGSLPLVFCSHYYYLFIHLFIYSFI